MAAEPNLSLDLGKGVALELVLVGPGSYDQGSPADEPGRKDDETSRRTTISEELYLGKFPVTRGQFSRFASETGYRTEAEKGTSGGYGFDGQGLTQRKEFTWRNPGFAQTDEHPVVLVTYDDALAFAAWLTRKTGRTIALPTEAQWELACRAGTQTAYPGGADLQAAEAGGWFRSNAGDGTRPVGQKQANAWGLFDMTGNVYEWCRDWYGPYEPGSLTDPEQTRSDLSDKPRRVLRGGSWLKDAADGRCGARYRNTPGSRNADNGFRVAASISVSTGAAPALPAERDASRASASKPGSSRPAPVPGAGRPTFFWMHYQLIFLIAAALFLLVFVYALRSRARQARSDALFDARRKRLPTAPAEDGFWIHAPQSMRGRSVRYECSASSSRLTDVVELNPSPKGHFVYTGGPPTEIVAELVELDSPQALAQPQRPAPKRAPESEPEPFSGYPSAY